MTRIEVEALKKQIDEHEYISFDVFDTLLIRDFCYPVDVFKYIEDIHNIKDFQKERIMSEVIARSNNMHLADITFEEISKELKKVDSQIELDTEKLCCVANNQLKEIYDYAVSQNKYIIAISDMYLDQTFVELLLIANDFDSIQKVYVSGNLNMTKNNGQLFEYVLKNLGIDAKKQLHIGDNYHSDYLKAKAKGIGTYYYKALREQLNETYNEYLLKSVKEHNTPQSSLFAGVLANNYLQNTQKGYWYQFGFEYAGILIFNFIHHIYEYCKKNNITRIYFMARDGKIMQEVFDALYSHDTTISTHYMLASRRLFFVPSIKDVDNTTLEALTESIHGTPYIDVINRLGFEWLVSEAKQHFSDIYKPIINKLDRAELKDFFILHKNKILEETSEERDNLLAYLNDIEFLNDENRLIVDVGWGCSSQKYLESTIDEKIHAIYFGTHKYTYGHELTHGYIFDKGLPEKENDLVLSALPVVELLFIGNHYSVVRIDKNLNPIYHKESREEEHRIEIALDIHEGILSFVNRYQKLLTKYKLLPDYSLNIVVLTALLIKPSIEDVINISKVPHAAAFGESSYEPIIKNLDLTQRQYLKNILLGKTSDNSSLWAKGKLHYQKLLNKRHYKSLENLSLFFTKIQHCHSYSIQICMKKIIRKISAKWQKRK